MPAPLSEDLRERIIATYIRGGLTYDELAERFAVGRASVARFLRLHRTTGSVSPKPPAGGTAHRLDEEARRAVTEIVDSHPDATLATIAEKWASERPELAVSVATIGRAIRSAGFTLKKRRFARRNAIGRR